MWILNDSFTSDPLMFLYLLGDVLRVHGGPGVAVNPTIAGYGKLTADPLPIAKIAANRKAASTLVDKVGFDN